MWEDTPSPAVIFHGARSASRVLDNPPRSGSEATRAEHGPITVVASGVDFVSSDREDSHTDRGVLPSGCGAAGDQTDGARPKEASDYRGRERISQPDYTRRDESYSTDVGLPTRAIAGPRPQSRSMQALFGDGDRIMNLQHGDDGGCRHNVEFVSNRSCDLLRNTTGENVGFSGRGRPASPLSRDARGHGQTTDIMTTRFPSREAHFLNRDAGLHGDVYADNSDAECVWRKTQVDVGKPVNGIGEIFAASGRQNDSRTLSPMYVLGEH
jgi:hypothetical protein